jgi:hypothetical protein
MLCGALFLAGFVGCGGPTASPPATGTPGQPAQAATAAPAKAQGTATKPTDLSKTGDPASAVAVFLEAVRHGDDETTAAMFTPVAREKVNALGIQVAPPGSDTAKFAVGKVETLAADGARVECTWTDLDENGKPRTDQITWMVRHEKEGWRVAGMAAMVFPGEPPVLLDFEKPEETLKKLEMLREEISRRSQPEGQQAQRPEEPGNSVQR